APYAAATTGEVERMLGRYARTYAALRRGVCVAASVGEAPGRAAQRLDCLDDRLAELSGVVERLESGDAPIAVAARAASRLTALSSGIERGSTASTTTTTPAVPARLRRQLADSKALGDVGRTADARVAIAAIEPELAAIGYRPLQAEAAALAGELAR